MTVLSKDDMDIIRVWKKNGVLTNVAGHRFNQSEGVVMLICGDGDCSGDMIDYKRILQNPQRNGSSRIHLIACNGGAIRLAKNSPANAITPGFDEYLLTEVLESVAVKNIASIALYTHALCGKATLHEISIMKTMSLLISAKKRVKEKAFSRSVAAFFHITYPDGRQRTYFVDRQQWEEWIAKNKACGYCLHLA